MVVLLSCFCVIAFQPSVEFTFANSHWNEFKEPIKIAEIHSSYSVVNVSILTEVLDKTLNKRLKEDDDYIIKKTKNGNHSVFHLSLTENRLRREGKNKCKIQVKFRRSELVAYNRIQQLAHNIMRKIYSNHNVEVVYNFPIDESVDEIEIPPEGLDCNNCEKIEIAFLNIIQNQLPIERLTSELKNPLDFQAAVLKLREGILKKAMEQNKSSLDLNKYPDCCKVLHYFLDRRDTQTQIGFRSREYRLTESIINSLDEELNIVLEVIEPFENDHLWVEFIVIGYADALTVYDISLDDDLQYKIEWNEGACTKNTISDPNTDYRGIVMDRKLYNSSLKPNSLNRSIIGKSIRSNCELSSVRAYNVSKYIYDKFKFQNINVEVYYAGAGIDTENPITSKSDQDILEKQRKFKLNTVIKAAK